MPNNLKPKAVRLLSALLDGQILEFEGRKWAIGEGGNFGCVCTSQGEDGKSEEQVYGVDFTIPQFIKFAESIPNETLFLLGAQAVLSRR